MFKRRGLGLIATLLAVFSPVLVFAQTNLDTVGATTGLGTDLIQTIGRVVGVILSLLGVVLLGLMLYAGFLWMTAGGKDEQVKKAKDTMVRAVVGFAIILMSYAIVTFIMNAFGANMFGGGNNKDNTGPTAPPFSNSLGNGGIVDHYPERDAVGIPKNARIIITFRGIVSPQTFITGYIDKGTPGIISDDEFSPNGNFLKDGLVTIYPKKDGKRAAFAGSDVKVGFSITDTTSTQTSTFVFSVPVLKGNENYVVDITDSLTNSANAALVANGGYSWNFTTSDLLDLSPPHVVNVTPVADQTFDRNIAVQLTFNEPMDPTSVSGMYKASTDANNPNPAHGEDFDNISVLKGDVAAHNLVNGNFGISNGYKTVTYLTLDACGTNSCGQTIYCLPGNESISVFARSPLPADVSKSPIVPATPYPAIGVTDVVGNALDGNADGIITPGSDNYSWKFRTTDKYNPFGPKLLSISPNIMASEVALDVPLVYAFDDILLANTATSVNFWLKPAPQHDLAFVTRLQTAKDPVTGKVTNDVALEHGVLLESTAKQNYIYSTMATEQVLNQYQNCFNPAEGPGDTGNKCTPTATMPYCCDGTPSATSCIPRT